MATANTNLERAIAKADGEATASETAPEKEAYVPMYRKIGNTRIPVSKARGSLWKSRLDSGKGKLKDDGTYDAWDEAVRYYKNDQTGKRNRDNPDNPSPGNRKALTGGDFAVTENLVFSNVSALVPSIYAKNPDVTIHSAKGDEDRPFTVCAQKLLRVLMQKRTAPGVNLKPKARRGVVMTTLTNASYIEVGYTRREQSSEQAMQEIERLSAELENAKTQKEIEEIEGKLMALDDKIDLLQPPGPWTRVLHPRDVVIDPDASLNDASDAKWIMIRDVFETSFLNAVYRHKDPETGQYVSEYKPTHVMKASGSSPNIAGHTEEITSFSVLKEGETGHKQYGFDNEHDFKRAQRTYVWKVWDRTTRRVEWYAENEWTWPIWVWDDPYGFDDFFPLAPLAFHTDPEQMHGRGEVSYYLDQQDEINRINSQVAKMRHRVSNMVVYNKRAVKSENDILPLVGNVDENKVIGIELPEDMKLEDVVMAPPIPAVEFASLFDKRQSYEAIDRMSGVSSVLRAVEFRTNTTNKAIDSYESSTAMRLDEKIDAIEEQIGRVGYMILVLCLQFMSKEEVIALIGAENAEAWPGGNMSARDARERFSLTVVGGSSLKPTSKVRKEQAKETAQIIGQFGAQNPAAFLIVLRMFQRAFSDELILESSDWDMITQSIEQQLGLQEQSAAGGGGEAGGNMKLLVSRLGEMFAKMPPELRAQVGKAIADGVPLEEIIVKLQEVAAGQQQPAQQKKVAATPPKE